MQKKTHTNFVLFILKWKGRDLKPCLDAVKLGKNQQMIPPDTLNICQVELIKDLFSLFMHDAHNLVYYSLVLNDILKHSRGNVQKTITCQRPSEAVYHQSNLKLLLIILLLQLAVALAI